MKIILIYAQITGRSFPKIWQKIMEGLIGLSINEKMPNFFRPLKVFVFI